MAFVQAFTTSQNTGSPSVLTITDTSTGVDLTITQRRVYLIRSDDTYLVPTGTTTDYIAWALVDTSININVLDVDYALNIRVDWLNVSNVAVYTLTTLTNFDLYANRFFYELNQFETSDTKIKDENNYYNNMAKLLCAINQSENATIFGDIFSAQKALDRAARLVNNPQLFY